MKLLFISLGCDKNLVDSEEMLGILTDNGIEITDDEQEADVIVVNTCCFIHDAKEESIQNILDMARYRTEGNCRALIVTGCLAQRYKEEIRQEIPEVDAVLGTTSYDEIMTAINTALQGETFEDYRDINFLPKVKNKRVITTGGHYSYLKIAEGCDKHCTYCIIPKIRGDFRSVPMEDLLEQAAYLVSQGVSELTLVAQETTVYGTDLYGEKKLHELLTKLCQIEDLHWIRVQYCYPEEIYDELLEVIAKEDKICKYLDLPIQHASSGILKKMGRRMDQEKLIDIIANIREKVPKIVLRTTLISGFPGETQQDHEILKQFVEETQFDRLGVFTYSPEEGTPAANMDNQIDEEVKLDRQAEIMEIQQDISFEKGEQRVGESLEVFIEGKVADEAAYVGRTYADAPGVDGYIFVQTGRELMSGDFVQVRVTGALEYDLIGELEDEFTE
ncbi:MAG: 30S ribosomal protein S12 methylthiotransferase RimO [Lachnospiraceae bacterium]|nr:30S ribosomal protein S12 methylthiotransferase RimO [Lachnospiraceae bacterium]MDD3615099.1 30S ribosomal protein S12 methylthiotransferase RimO [Lachnospiraceae bacterium]